MPDTQLDPARAALESAKEVDMAGMPSGDGGGDGQPPYDGPPDGADGSGEDGFDDVLLERIGAASRFPLNDIGNGRRFVTYFGDSAMRIPRVGWFTWCGTHWKRDDDELAVRRLGQQISALMEREIERLTLDDWQMQALDTLDADEAELKRLTANKSPSEEERAALGEIEMKVRKARGLRAYLSHIKKTHRAFAKSTGNSAKIDAMLREGSVSISHTLDAVDADPLVVNTETATLRFKVTPAPDPEQWPLADLVQSDHSRDDLLTKCMPVPYDATAKAPLFDAFMAEIQPKESMRLFIQRWFGLSMLGVPVQKLAFFYGHGANGKSVLVELLCKMLDAYSATAPIEALTGQGRRGGSDATPELMPLIGARTVRASEPEQGERFKEGMIKSLTSGEPIAVRALHSDFIFINPFFKLTISGNHKPEIRGTDDGIWRRVLLVPFDVQIPEERRDVHLIDKLWAERAGVLNWMIEGALSYLERGLQVPAEVEAATADYRKDSDPTGAFLTDATVVTGNPDDFIFAKDLIAAMKWWQEQEGGTPWGDRACGLRLKEKADKWAHPDTQKTFTPHRKQSTGYRGLKFNDIFLRRFEDRQTGGGYGKGQTGGEGDW